MISTHRRASRLWTAVGVGLVLTVYPAFLLRLLLARQRGLAIVPALQAVLAPDEVIRWVLMPLLGLVVGLSMLAVVFWRRTPPPTEPAPTGSARWRRLRLIITLGPLPLVVFVVARLLYLLANGQPMEQTDWVWSAIAVMDLLLIAYYWQVRPAPEYLHALETGDRSRMDDERAQHVRGRGAAAAIVTFVLMLAFVGLPYEVLALGQWPVRSFLEALLLLLVWDAAGRLYNRRL